MMVVSEKGGVKSNKMKHTEFKLLMGGFSQGAVSVEVVGRLNLKNSIM